MSQTYNMASTINLVTAEMTSNLSATLKSVDSECEMPLEMGIEDLIARYVVPVLMFVVTLGNLLSFNVFP